jgi:hypothetical protein
MSKKRLGKAFIKVDGKLLESMPGAKIDIGGPVRNPVVGNTQVHGFAESVKESTMECEISVGTDTSLDALRKIEDATITFEADTGQTYVIRNAWLTEPPVVTDGEGGKVPLKFAGPPAEEMK